MHDELVTFYHGTSYQNYQQIMKTGIIKCSNLDGVTKKELNQLPDTLRSINEVANGKVFLTDDFEMALYYALCGRGRDAKTAEEQTKSYHGVVMELDINKMDISAFSLRNEFYQEKPIKIDSIKMIYHVYYKDGIISILDEDGREILQ